MNFIEHIVASPFFVGWAGALVSLKFAPGAGWMQRATHLVCGSLIAGYIAQPLGDWLALPQPRHVLGVAFVLGLLGLSVGAAATKAIGDLKLADIVTGWISRRG